MTMVGQRARAELVKQSCEVKETWRRGASSEKLIRVSEARKAAQR